MNFLSTREFAARIDVVPETVRRWVRAGRLKPHGKTVTGRLRFTEAQVSEALCRAEEPETAPFDLSRHVATALKKHELRTRSH